MADQVESCVQKFPSPSSPGDQEMATRLLESVYTELRQLAQARMAHLPPGQTLQPTALVHEAYLRLVGKPALPVEGRKQFFFAAARAMRDILVERARSKAGPKRGGSRHRVELTDTVAIDEPPAEQLLALHEALSELEKEDPLKGQILSLHYFTGMTIKETAEVLGVTERTIHRHWRFIKAWLKNRLEKGA